MKVMTYAELLETLKKKAKEYELSESFTEKAYTQSFEGFLISLRKAHVHHSKYKRAHYNARKYRRR
jgi:hypothetical protein